MGPPLRLTAGLSIGRSGRQGDGDRCARTSGTGDPPHRQLHLVPVQVFLLLVG